MKTNYTVRTNKYRTLPEIRDFSICIMRRLRSRPISHSVQQLEPYRSFECVCILDDSDQVTAVDSILDRYPWITFIIAAEGMLPGNRIDAAAQTVRSEIMLVMWDDMELRTQLDPYLLRWLKNNRPLCAAPIIRCENDLVPVIHVPILEDHRFTIWSFTPYRDRTATLMPDMFCGMYDRSALQRLGGFGEDFSNQYWQLADFGLRSWLGSFPILTCNGLQVDCDERQPAYDATEDNDYQRLLRRCAGFRITGGKVVPQRRTLVGSRIPRAYHAEIAELQHWAKKDLRQLVELWESPETEDDA